MIRKKKKKKMHVHVHTYTALAWSAGEDPMFSTTESIAVERREVSGMAEGTTLGNWVSHSSATERPSCSLGTSSTAPEGVRTFLLPSRRIL